MYLIYAYTLYFTISFNVSFTKPNFKKYPLRGIEYFITSNPSFLIHRIIWVFLLF